MKPTIGNMIMTKSKQINTCSPKVLSELKILGMRSHLLKDELGEWEPSLDVFDLFGDLSCERKFYNFISSLCQGKPHDVLAMDKKLRGDWRKTDLKLPVDVLGPSAAREGGMIIVAADGLLAFKPQKFTWLELECNAIASRIDYLCDVNPNHPTDIPFSQDFAALIASETRFLQSLRSLYLGYPQTNGIALELA
jgi:hypothetical protein